MIGLFNAIYNQGYDIGFNDHGGLGDRMVRTMFPENWFLTFNKKLIDIDNSYVYEHNPFVQRKEVEKIGIVLDLHYGFVYNKDIKINTKAEFMDKTLSFGEKYCKSVGLKYYLRNPRLYIYEDEIINYNRVIIHGQGTGARLPSQIANKIAENYKNLELVQVGDIRHPMLHEKFIDKRGLPFWECVKIIASSFLFIGVNSGFYHVANCYNKIFKKLICHEGTEEQFQKLVPLISTEGTWFDFGIEIYNKYEYDIGVSKSYLKI